MIYALKMSLYSWNILRIASSGDILVPPTISTTLSPKTRFWLWTPVIYKWLWMLPDLFCILWLEHIGSQRVAWLSCHSEADGLLSIVLLSEEYPCSKSHFKILSQIRPRDYICSAALQHMAEHALPHRRSQVKFPSFSGKPLTGHLESCFLSRSTTLSLTTAWIFELENGLKGHETIY